MDIVGIPDNLVLWTLIINQTTDFVSTAGWCYIGQKLSQLLHFRNKKKMLVVNNLVSLWTNNIDNLFFFCISFTFLKWISDEIIATNWFLNIGLKILISVSHQIIEFVIVVSLINLFTISWMITVSQWKIISIFIILGPVGH